MQEEDMKLKHRLKDLAARSYEGNMYLYTGFLSIGEQAIFYDIEKEISYAGCILNGGPQGCERRMLRFGSPESFGYEEEWPFSCIIVEPVIKKFAENLTHRDYLGALMHLGIERDVIGDIVIRDGIAYIICIDRMTEYIISHLDRIRHTSVRCMVSKEMPEQAEPVFQIAELVVSSERCDSVVSKVFSLSRSQSLDLFRAKKIFVNGRQYENNSGCLKESDIVSVRGFGKFVFDGIEQETRKGRVRVKIRKYV